MAAESPALPSVVPMPTYEDVAGAIDWLGRAFGFEELERYADDQGRVTTAILRAGADGAVMLGFTSPEYESPRRHRATCEAAARWSRVPYVMDGVLVQVTDVDAHCARARAAGAVVLSDPEDTPHGRQYRVEDHEGHRWMFVSG
jgi:PhnB protein